MSRLVKVVVATAAVLGWVGCGGGDDDVGAVFDQLLAAESARADALCDCYAELGYPARAGCLMDFAPSLTAAQPSVAG